MAKEKTYNLLKLWGVPIIGNDKEYIKVREEVKYVYQNQGKPKSLLQYFDMSNWIDYYIIETYTANLDWIQIILCIGLQIKLINGIIYLMT